MQQVSLDLEQMGTPSMVRFCGTPAGHAGIQVPAFPPKVQLETFLVAVACTSMVDFGAKSDLAK
jgi:hypothetical protein